MKLMKYFNECCFVSKLKLLKTFIDLPGFVFHEVCHIVMALLVMAKIERIQLMYFYKIKDTMLFSYSMEVETQVSDNWFGKFRHILVAIAPAIGCIILVFYNPLFILYILFAWKPVWLSEQDVRNLQNNLRLLNTQLFNYK